MVGGYPAPSRLAPLILLHAASAALPHLQRHAGDQVVQQARGGDLRASWERRDRRGTEQGHAWHEGSRQAGRVDGGSPPPGARPPLRSKPQIRPCPGRRLWSFCQPEQTAAPRRRRCLRRNAPAARREGWGKQMGRRCRCGVAGGTLCGRVTLSSPGQNSKQPQQRRRCFALCASEAAALATARLLCVARLPPAAPGRPAAPSAPPPRSATRPRVRGQPLQHAGRRGDARPNAGPDRSNAL